MNAFEQGDEVITDRHGEGYIIEVYDAAAHPIMVGFRYPPRYINFTMAGVEEGYEAITLKRL